MAARTAIVRAVEIVRGNDQARNGETLTATKVALVSIDNGSVGTVIGGTDTLDCDLSAAISAVVRNGRTVAVRGACVAGPAHVSGTAYAATHSLSSNTISLTPKSASDWSTNATLPVGPVSANDRPFMVAVCYSES
jgi:hypothetical protein